MPAALEQLKPVLQSAGTAGALIAGIPWYVVLLAFAFYVYKHPEIAARWLLVAGFDTVARRDVAATPAAPAPTQHADAPLPVAAIQPPSEAPASSRMAA